MDKETITTSKATYHDGQHRVLALVGENLGEDIQERKSQIRRSRQVWFFLVLVWWVAAIPLMVVLLPQDYRYKGYGEFDYDMAMQIAAEHEENAVVLAPTGVDGMYSVAYNFESRTKNAFGLDGEARWTTKVALAGFTFFVGVIGLAFLGDHAWTPLEKIRVT